MNELHRDLAPLSEAAWTAIEEEATQTLKATLAARKIVDFKGPLGWQASAVDLGRVQGLKAAPAKAVVAQRRQVLPLVELRAPFQLERSEIEALDRGAADADLDPVIAAAKAIAVAEDRAIFHGFADGGIEGICEGAKAGTLTLTEDYLRYPAVVAEALGKLRAAGIDGPYGLVLGPKCYQGLVTTTNPAGFPVLEHVRRLIDGPLVWAQGVDGAVVLSLRGGDFELTVGQDFSIGYLEHTAATVRLYLQETLTFRSLAPEAAVPLVYGKKRK